MRFFIFSWLLILCVVHEGSESETLLPEFNTDDIDYTKLFDDPEIIELFEGFSPKRNYSKFFHLDSMLGFHGSFHNLGCYWANAWKRHFTWGDTYKNWRTGLIGKMKNNKDDSGSYSYYEYFNFMQSFWSSPSFTLLPTWTWQIKDSHWFFSVGGFFEWTGYNFYYDFLAKERKEFIDFSKFQSFLDFQVEKSDINNNINNNDIININDINNDENRNNNINQSKKNVELENKYAFMIKNDYFDVYNQVFSKKGNYHLDPSLLDNGNIEQYYGVRKAQNGEYSYFLDTIYFYDKPRSNDNADVNGLNKGNKEKIFFEQNINPISIKTAKGEKKKYFSIVRKRLDNSEEAIPDNGEFFLSKDDYQKHSCRMSTKTFRLGGFINLAWYKNKIDPFSSWHFGFSFGGGPQLGYRDCYNFQFGKFFKMSNYKNCTINRSQIGNFNEFQNDINFENFGVRPWFCFLQFELGFNRLSLWFRVYTSPFIIDKNKDCSLSFFNEDIIDHIWMSFKNLKHPMFEMNSDGNVDANGILKPSFVFSKLGFSLGVKISI